MFFIFFSITRVFSRSGDPVFFVYRDVWLETNLLFSILCNKNVQAAKKYYDNNVPVDLGVTLFWLIFYFVVKDIHVFLNDESLMCLTFLKDFDAKLLINTFVSNGFKKLICEKQKDVVTV